MCIRDSHNMEQEFDVYGGVAHGDLSAVTGWLREKVHQYGHLLELSLIHISSGVKPGCSYGRGKFSLARRSVPPRKTKAGFTPLVPKAVSYTHLDVYKRQVKGCSVSPRPQWPRSRPMISMR